MRRTKSFKNTVLIGLLLVSIALLLMVTISPAPPARAWIKDISFTNYGLGAVEDTYVDSGSRTPSGGSTSCADTIFNHYWREVYPGGQSNRMYVGRYTPSGGTTEFERSYVKFNVTGKLDGPTFSRVELLIYDFQCTTAPPSVVPYALRDDTWDETTLTWNNAPPPEEAVSTPVTVLTGSNGCGWVSWNVTSYVREQMADGIVSFVLMDPVSEAGAVDLSVNFSTYDGDGPDKGPILRFICEDHYADVQVLPVNKVKDGLPGQTLTWPVTITNVGLLSDTYDLTVSDVDSWNPTISPASISLDNGVSGQATVSVTLPANAIYYNTMTITATSRADLGVSASDDAYAVAGLLPSDDAEVHENLPNNNYGGSGNIYVAPHGQSFWIERSYMKFDLSGINVADVRAKLCLYAFKTGGDVQCRKVENNNWSEFGITWNDQPDPNGGTEVLGTISTVALGWYELDVTDWVQSHAGGDVSFGLRAGDDEVTGTWNVAFDSKDASGGSWYALRPYLRFVPKYMVGVDVSDFQKYQENAPGSQLTYTIYVNNLGSEQDSYHMSCSGTQAGWTLALSTAQTGTIVGGGSENVYLTVTIPDSAASGTLDNITVTATSNINPSSVTDGVQVVACAFVGIKPVPSDDTYVDENNKGNSHFDDPRLYVGRYHDYRENAYLKFDIKDVSAGATILKAELWMWSYSTYPYYTTDINLEACRVDDDGWTGADVTWNSHPEIGALLDTVHVTNDRQWYKWDVTSFVLDQLANDSYKVVSLCVRPQVNCPSNKSASFRSTDYLDYPADWPCLKIFYAPPPGVDVSISPASEVGLRGSTITYTVTVTNTGTVQDTYSLAKSENVTPSWSTLSSASLTVPAGENRTATLSVTVPASLSEDTYDSITVTATGTGVSASGSCIARGILVNYREVQVSISPSSKNGENGSTLTYTVTVKNTGTITDTYTLENSNTAGWALTLLPSSVTDVIADQERQVTLTVKIPATAADGASTTITVTATSTENTAVEGSKTCVANCGVIPPIGTGVQVKISGESSKPGAPGETLNFYVDVTNTGTGTDSFTLTVTDTKGWSPTVLPTSTTLAGGASRTGVKLSITIPAGATLGTEDTITVTATSQTSSAVKDNATCTATAQAGGGISPFVYVGAVVAIVAVIAVILRLKPF